MTPISELAWLGDEPAEPTLSPVPPFASLMPCSSIPPTVPRRNRAFTLVELLVVMAIIGILVAVLLPAVQAAREAARRIECRNHLKQLALAVHNYHDAHRVLPPSGIGAPSSGYYDPLAGAMFSWITLILPQIEQGNLHDRFDFRQPILQQSSDPQATSINTLLCPSDAARGRVFRDPVLTQGRPFAKGNYVAYVSPYHVEFQNRFPGALVAGRQQNFASLVDGVSSTLMLTEIRTRAHEQDQRGAWALPWNATSQLAFDMHHAEPFAFGDYGFAYNPSSLGFTQRPNSRGPNIDMLYSCPDPAAAQLERMPCSVFTGSVPGDYLSAAPRSHHPQGVNGAFADGHVSFISNQVDEIIMAYAISVDDGQVADLDASSH